ncbi:MAG: helix-turn-helix domain-containing protein [Armatimonadetes bacterium]|nr:helix-turn-helix domain-containing protein [Armatimonadota bacterium]
MKKKEFDPQSYIDNAFLDKPANGKSPIKGEVPNFGEYLAGSGRGSKRFRKTELSAPRPRRSRKPQTTSVISEDLYRTWEKLPKLVEFLNKYFDDNVTSNYYRGEFKESRDELIRRLLDPELSLEDTSRLLGVCPATVRRYTNRKWLSHHRTKGGQRRFRLSNIARFVEEHGRLPEE